jgi:hypothetical protein
MHNVRLAPYAIAVLPVKLFALLLTFNESKQYTNIQFLPRSGSATEPNRLMLFRETVAVYCENHTEHTNNI